jgi:hypothetical protein
MEKIKQLLIAGGGGAAVLPETLTRAFNDLFSRQALNSGVLAVGSTTTKLKITNQINYVLNGVLGVIAASDGATTWVESGSSALPANSLTATQIGGYVFTVDASGLFHALAMTPSVNLASAPGFPFIPANQCVFGLALINTSNPVTWTAGTTLVSATSVQLINQVGPFYPSNAF